MNIPMHPSMSMPTIVIGTATRMKHQPKEELSSRVEEVFEENEELENEEEDEEDEENEETLLDAELEEELKDLE